MALATPQRPHLLLPPALSTMQAPPTRSRPHPSGDHTFLAQTSPTRARALLPGLAELCAEWQRLVYPQEQQAEATAEGMPEMSQEGPAPGHGERPSQTRGQTAGIHMRVRLEGSGGRAQAAGVSTEGSGQRDQTAGVRPQGSCLLSAGCPGFGD